MSVAITQINSITKRLQDPKNYVSTQMSLLKCNFVSKTILFKVTAEQFHISTPNRTFRCFHTKGDWRRSIKDKEVYTVEKNSALHLQLNSPRIESHKK